MNDKEIARVIISNKLEYIPFIVGFVKDLSMSYGFSEEDSSKIELSLEETCVNVIQHAFDPGEEGTYTIIVLTRPNQFVVAIEDQGLPTDINKIHEEKKIGLGLTLIKAFADQVVFLNLGQKGKRFELINYLPARSVEDYITEEDKQEKITEEKASKEEKIFIRFMKDNETVKLARCIYRSYGYTYINDFYYPDKISELLKNGMLKSCVSVNDKDEIIGHLGLNFEYAGAKIAEVAQAAVDPRYRGRHLFEDMKNFCADYGRKNGLYGLYSESVSIHPYTQKGNLSMGAQEIGILLGFIPETTFFKKIQDGKQVQRQAAILYYMKLNEEPCRNVYLPEKHREIISKIYEKNKMRRIIEQAKEKYSLPLNSLWNINVRSNMNFAFMKLVTYGQNFREMLHIKLKGLCEERIDCIYLDLPLSDPWTETIYEEVEKMGFFFGGIIPEIDNGDVIRFQYLNNVPINPEKICVVSDFGKYIFKYIMESYSLKGGMS